MMISTRGRYAIRVMIDLAANAGTGFVSIKEIARRQAISFKYLERIMQILGRAGLVASTPGRRGGYRLAMDASSCTVGKILRATEKTLAPVACLVNDAQPCKRAPGCPTLPMWKEFNALANAFFDNVSIADLLQPAARPNILVSPLASFTSRS